MKERLQNALFAVLLAVAGLLAWGGLTNGHDWGDDFSAYIMQARSLTEGNPLDFIEKNRVTVQQSSYPMGPVLYPWGFPALLVPIYAVLGLNMLALKSVGVAGFLLFLLVLWVAFRKYHSGWWRVVLICLFALNPEMLGFTNQILSDIPFLLFSTLGVMLIGRVVVERRRLISPLIELWLIGPADRRRTA